MDLLLQIGTIVNQPTIMDFENLDCVTLNNGAQHTDDGKVRSYLLSTQGQCLIHMKRTGRVTDPTYYMEFETV